LPRFSFFDVEVTVGDGPPVRGYIYYPQPDTKPAHFQNPAVLELLLPFVKGVEYGATLKLRVPANQLAVHEPATPGTRG